jgi:Raf kinase inhibitor-like YbhB/YbcL family protein
LLLLAGCHHATPLPKSVDGETFPLSSDAFRSGGTIPTRFTCDGVDVSPPLSWTHVPKGARPALVVNDPDAPGGNFVHWIAYLLPGTTRLPEGRVPAGAVQGTNSFGHRRYEGPCPPHGDPPHHYNFTVYAFRGGPFPSPTVEPATALREIVVGSVAKGRITVTYGR